MKLNPERLIEARGLAGISQRELAERCGVSKTSIVNYETAHLSPRKTTVYRVARALDVSVEFLCSSDKDRENEASRKAKEKSGALDPRDEAHRKAVRNQIIQALVERGLEREYATGITQLIASGKIPHMEIDYQGIVTKSTNNKRTNEE